MRYEGTSDPVPFSLPIAHEGALQKWTGFSKADQYLAAGAIILAGLYADDNSTCNSGHCDDRSDRGGACASSASSATCGRYRHWTATTRLFEVGDKLLDRFRL
jgi:hypothetical protein